MELEEGADVGAAFDDSWMPANLADAVAQGHAASFAVQPLGRPHASEAAAADAGDAEHRDLLGEEIDDLEIVLELYAFVLERAGNFERRDDTRNAVEPAAVRHGIGMRANHNRAAVRIPPRPVTDEIAGRIDTRREPGRAEL